MKKITVIICLLVIAGCNQSEENRVLNLDNEKLRLGYALGVQVDLDAIKNPTEQERAALMAGINDGMDGNESKLDKDDTARAVKEVARIKKEVKMAEFKELQARNKVEADAFLLEHSKKKGVIVTDSGLQYEVIKAGNGSKPGIADSVRVLYDGKLMDGTVFNPFHKPGDVTTFKVNGVIKGWEEGLQLMSVGSKYRFILPPALAFGEFGAGANLPPNAVMIFEIELLAIEKHKTEIQKSGN